jgi:brefeldin A-resistance guanine nucleotide exchange factor 1
LAASLRTTSTLFSTLLPQLKLQLELFLSYLIDRLTPSTPIPIPAALNSALPISRPSSPSVAGARADTPLLVEGEKDPLLAIDPTTPVSTTPRPLSMLPPVPAETKELMLDTLTQIAARPSFMVDCWVNFDCSTDSEDMFERLLAFLTRVGVSVPRSDRKPNADGQGVYPAAPLRQDGSSSLFEGLENVQLLSLEILLEFVSSMADRAEQGDEPWLEVRSA